MTTLEKDGFDAIEYPLDFAFKAVCIKSSSDPVESLQDIVHQAVANVVGVAAIKNMSLKESSAGKYVSITTITRIKNRQELEAIYRAISALDIVKMTL